MAMHSRSRCFGKSSLNSALFTVAIEDRDETQKGMAAAQTIPVAGSNEAMCTNLNKPMNALVY